MADETTPKADEQATEKPPAKAAGGEAAPAAKAKKEKPPAVEDKPFPEFIKQDFMPAVKNAMAKEGITDLYLAFENRSYPIPGLVTDPCWQVIGQLNGGRRQFIIGFSKEDIAAPKFFCSADRGATPSVLESFMIDERKVTLDLMVQYTLQRLNGQKWLVRN